VKRIDDAATAAAEDEEEDMGCTCGVLVALRHVSPSPDGEYVDDGGSSGVRLTSSVQCSPSLGMNRRWRARVPPTTPPPPAPLASLWSGSLLLLFTLLAEQGEGVVLTDKPRAAAGLLRLEPSSLLLLVLQLLLKLSRERIKGLLMIDESSERMYKGGEGNEWSAVVPRAERTRWVRAGGRKERRGSCGPGFACGGAGERARRGWPEEGGRRAGEPVSEWNAPVPKRCGWCVRQPIWLEAREAEWPPARCQAMRG